MIAGRRHEAFWDLKHLGVEVEGFVSDVRPAYRRATIVIAPLVASAGTNIKIMEAMAMGKAIVSTEAGIHGLELERGRDAVVTDSADEMAAEISAVAGRSRRKGRAARACSDDGGTSVRMGRNRQAASRVVPVVVMKKRAAKPAPQ